MRSGKGALLALGMALVWNALACGGNRAPDAPGPAGAGGKNTPAPGASGASGASGGSAAGAPAAGDAGADGGRPFAGSAGDATQLIQQALDTQTAEMNRCVKEFRFRKHLAHERVDIAVGIDQDGHILGVTLPKRAPDDELARCVQSALHDAPFPRSHAGVITVTRSFEEMVR